MGLINQQGQDLVSRFIDLTEKYGGTDPLKHLELYSLNVIFFACFGREFHSIDDPEFIKLINMINTSMEFAGLKNDWPNFLPALSFVDSFTGIQDKMKRFINEQLSPTVKKFIQEATKNNKPNIVKSLEENGYVLSEDEKVVLMCNILIKLT